MLRPHSPQAAICPRCELPGVHNDDDCLAAYRAAIAAETPRPRPAPKLEPTPKRPAPLPPVEMPTDLSTPLTVNQACALVQVTRRAMYVWMQQGKVAWEYTPGGARRIYRASLLRAHRDVAR